MIQLNLLNSIVSASLAIMTAGTPYLSSLYFPQLSTALNLSQKETSFIAASANNGVYLSGPVFGHLVDRLRTRTGMFLISGGLTIFIGYSIVSGIYSRLIPQPHFLVVSLVFLIVGCGSSAIYHCALTTNCRNWPLDKRGVAVGITVGVFGVAASVFAEAGSRMFSKADVLDVGDFLLFVGTSCLLINMLASLTLRDISSDTPATESPSETTPLIVGEPRDSWDDDLSSDDNDFVGDAEWRQSLQTGIPLEDISCFVYLDCYLLVFFMFTIAGIGLMFINNVGAIIVSLAAPDQDASHPVIHQAQRLHVLVLSIVGFLSRVLVGVLADTLDRTVGFPRSLWPIIGSVTMAAACCLILNAQTVSDILPASVLVATAYGVVWTITPVLLGEYFGFNKFGSNWGWMTVVPAFGGQAFSLIFGHVYDLNAVSHICKGVDCFYSSFTISLAVCLACLTSNVLLAIRRWPKKDLPLYQ